MFPSSDDYLRRSIPEHLERIIAQRGDHLAVTDGETSWCYAELGNITNHFAREILDRWGNAPEPVGLLLGHEVIVVPAILAILRAGKTYVPLDVHAPSNRNRSLLDSVNCRLLITDSTHRSQAESIAGSTMPVLVLTANPGRPSVSIPEALPAADAPAAIYFTSGSTGTPKGITRTHANLLWCVQLDRRELGYRHEDRFSFLYGHNNGGSIPDLYCSLLTGAALYFYDVRESGLDLMHAWLNRNQISSLHLNSTLMRTFVDHLPDGASFPHVRVVRLSQRLFADYVRKLWTGLSPSATVVHRYSSTEAGPVISHTIDHRTELTGEIVPLGRPLPGVEIQIVDDNGSPVTAGTVGEIIVRSPYMTPTARLEDGDVAFYHTGDLGRMRPDGMLEMVGREDSLVKIRGFLVSLTAIETALLQLDVVKEGVVVVHPDQNGDRVPLAYVVAASRSPELATELRRKLSEQLPPYALPARFVFLDSMPRLSNGKVDYHSLPAINGSRPTLDTPYEPPRTPFEEQLAAIWSEVLGIEPVGVHDRFLDLGGHSLLAAMIVSRVIHTMNITLSPPVLLQAPTVAEMASTLVNQEIGKLDNLELEALLGDLEDDGQAP